MRVGVVAENLGERIALASGLAPIPLIESWFTFTLARTIMVGTKLGVFEALAAGPLMGAEVAARCGTEAAATAKLLNALVGARYLRVRDDRYTLAPVSRRWLLKDSPQSCRDGVLFRFLEWHWWERCEDYVRTGQPVLVHEQMTDEDWGVYQRGMRSGIEMMATMVARKLPVPRGATELLDLGGSHGYWSVTVCRRHPQLRATILDLPQAIKHAAPILEREGMGGRVVHRPGDALTDDLGTDQYDVVFAASLVHHFDDATNRALMKRIARALRPNGIVAIWEPLRGDGKRRINQIGGLMDLGFGILSKSGAWSAEEIASWQCEAGLTPRRPIHIMVTKDLALLVARKNRES